MTTMTSYLPALRVAMDLVAKAEAAGILAQPSVCTTSVSMSAAHKDQTAILADILGLTNRQVFTYPDSDPIEVWLGKVDGMTVSTQRTMTRLSVFDAARAAGHDESCATRQHLYAVSECTCTRQVAS